MGLRVSTGFSFSHKVLAQRNSSHGLSYTTFSYSDLIVSKPTLVTPGGGKDLSITVSVVVTNTGTVEGSEVVQVYVAHPPTSALTQVPLALRTFKKVRNLKSGERRTVELTLDKYAVSYWEERINAWTIESGEYTAHVGSSSSNLPLKCPFVLGKAEAFEWNGL